MKQFAAPPTFPCSSHCQEFLQQEVSLIAVSNTIRQANIKCYVMNLELIVLSEILTFFVDY